MYRWRWEYGKYEAVDTKTNPTFKKSLELGGYECKRTPSSLAVFWSIGPGQHAHHVVSEEWKLLRSSGLLAEAARVVVNPHDWNVRNGGDHSQNARAWRRALLPANASVEAGDKLMETPRDSRNEPLYEFPTLVALWQHCHRNPKGFVLYMVRHLYLCTQYNSCRVMALLLSSRLSSSLLC